MNWVGTLHNKKVLLLERKSHTARCSGAVLSPGGGGEGNTYFGWGGGYLPWPGSTYLGWRGTHLGCGYLPWIEGTYPGWRVPTLAGAVPTLDGDTYLGQEYLTWTGVPTLDGGTYLGWGTNFGWRVPTLAREVTYPGWRGTHLGWGTYLGQGYLPRTGGGGGVPT